MLLVGDNKTAYSIWEIEISRGWLPGLYRVAFNVWRIEKSYCLLMSDQEGLGHVLCLSNLNSMVPNELECVLNAHGPEDQWWSFLIVLLKLVQ